MVPDHWQSRCRATVKRCDLVLCSDRKLARQICLNDPRFGKGSSVAPNEKNHILVCDDDAAITESLNMILSSRYHVHVARSTVEGYEMVVKYPVKVILLDIEFPNDESGLHAIEKFHTLNRHLQIVMISGFVYNEYILEACKKGACDFVAKPFSSEIIHDAIERALSISQSWPALDAKSKFGVVMFDRDPHFYISGQLVLKNDFKLFCCSNLALTLGILAKEKIDVLLFDFGEVQERITNFLVDVRHLQPDIRLIAAVANVNQALLMSGYPEVKHLILKNAPAFELLSIVNEAAESIHKC